MNKKSVEPIFYSLLAIFFGFIVGAVVLMFTGYNPFLAYRTLVEGIFSKPSFIFQSLIDASPLILTGLSVTFAFKTGLFNIGAEGQYIIGSLAATLSALFLPLPALLLAPIAILFGALAGALWGGLIGYLKAKHGISEVITSIMMNWIAFYLMNFIIMSDAVREPFSDTSRAIPVEAQINTHLFRFIVGKTTKVHFGLIITILVVFVIWFILNKTTLGYRLKAVGFNAEAAKASGISVEKSVFTSMAIAGCMAGLAGALQILGVQFRMHQLGAMESYGFNGLVVAFIGNVSPIGTFLGGLFFGALKFGGNKLTLIEIPKEVIDILMGTIVYFVASTGALKYFYQQWKLKKKKGEDKV